MGQESRIEAEVATWLRRTLPALLRSYRINQAYLFGSWARGGADQYSDVDLIIVAASRRPFVERFRDYPQLWQRAPTGIDLLIYTPEEFAQQQRSNRFIRHVLRYARRVV